MKNSKQISKKEIDYMLDIILNTFRMTKNIYRIDKTETCYDRNIAKSEEYCEKIRKAFESKYNPINLVKCSNCHDTVEMMSTGEVCPSCFC
jgi:hypothetical protein